MGAWNGWYHVTGDTYGTWVRGDERGWREWRHHEHVEGDYRNPPPSERSREPLAQSRRQMRATPVILTLPQRRYAGEAMVEALSGQDVEVLALSMGGEHYHILGRFRDGQVRPRVGRAKKGASHVLRAHGLPGTVWAKRCGVRPIQDRWHQINVFQYILDHAQEGAWTWHFRKPVPRAQRTGGEPPPSPGNDRRAQEGNPPDGEG
jgi:hypothetical protein